MPGIKYTSNTCCIWLPFVSTNWEVLYSYYIQKSNHTSQVFIICKAFFPSLFATFCKVFTFAFMGSILQMEK